jgi:hypothetical protein
MDDLIANSKYSLETAHQMLDSMWEEHKYLRINIKTGKQRNPTMNRCLHLYLTQVAAEMVNNGIFMNSAFPEAAEIAPTMELLKEYGWKPIQETVTGFESTTQPSNADYKTIFEIFSRYAAMNWGISLEWPNKEHMKDKRA